MKLYKKIILQVMIIFAGMSLTQCEGLDTEVFGEISASSGGAASESTVTGLLNGTYADFQLGTGPGLHFIYISEFSSDHIWNERGGLFNSSKFFFNWNWDAQNPSWIGSSFWAKPYRSIRNANFLLDIIDGANVDPAKKTQIKAEARFLRATAYVYLYNWFGAVPLRTSPSDDAELGRATEAELLSFIETELTEAATALRSEIAESGRATSGAAYAILMKHYLNTKNWAKVVETADLIDGLGLYSLYTAGTNSHRDLFRVPLEGDVQNETIFSIPAISANTGLANAVMSHSYPEGDYASFVDGSDVWQSNQSISGTKNRVFDFFYDSFDPNDDRKKQIINQWVNRDGETIIQPANKNSSFKYWPDPNMNTFASGHDYRIVRYADVLLSKAESLNEINGPTQGAIDLINQVRSRSNAPDLALGDFGSKEALRDAILDERGWEFHFEGKRREDLIRHGKFVTARRNHPVIPLPSAEDFRVLFPIPQAEIDVNPNLTQNPGY